MVLTTFNPETRTLVDPDKRMLTWSKSFSHVEPGLSEYAAEAWERMTYAGLFVGGDVMLSSHVRNEVNARTIEFYRNNLTEFVRDFFNRG